MYVSVKKPIMGEDRRLASNLLAFICFLLLIIKHILLIFNYFVKVQEQNGLYISTNNKKKCLSVTISRLSEASKNTKIVTICCPKSKI